MSERTINIILGIIFIPPFVIPLMGIIVYLWIAVIDLMIKGLDL